MKSTAVYFLFHFSDEEYRKYLTGIISKLNSAKKYRCKIILDKWGELKNITTELTNFTDKGNVVLSDFKTSPSNKFVYFKTTLRAKYDSEYNKWKENGFTDAIFMNENDNITEGAVTNIFIRKGNKYITPIVSSGLLEGCYRKYFMEKTGSEEKIITLNDILNADEMMIVNSVRKEIVVEKLYDSGGKLLKSFR